MDASEIKVGLSLYEFLKRPEVNYDLIEAIGKGAGEDVSDEVKEQCVIMTKYEGYIDKQLKQIDQFKKLENRKLPEDISYASIEGLRIEARQKLDNIKPISIGQASRISGVSPADISVLLIYLEQMRENIEEEIMTNKITIKTRTIKDFGIEVNDQMVSDLKVYRDMLSEMESKYES